MKCDLCSAQDAARYEVEYGWHQKVETTLLQEKVVETTYRPIGVLSRNVCPECGSNYLRKHERWSRSGWWLGPIMSVLLVQLGMWISRSLRSALWIPVFLLFMGFLYWSFWSLFMLITRLFDRDATVKEAIESDIWRSNVDRLREDLHKLDPHFMFQTDRDRSNKKTHSQLGHWHYCEPGGPTYKYFVKPLASNATTDWIHGSGKS